MAIAPWHPLAGQRNGSYHCHGRFSHTSPLFSFMPNTPPCASLWFKGRMVCAYLSAPRAALGHTQAVAMNLLLFVCVCALAAAEEAPAAVPTAGQLTAAISSLYRRFLHVAAPKQLEIQDALDIKWRNGMMGGKPFRSPVRRMTTRAAFRLFGALPFILPRTTGRARIPSSRPHP